MTGPLKTGRLPARICPECKQSFLPKRIDTVLCSRECRNAEQKRKRREANAAKLKTIKCVICQQPFKQSGLIKNAAHKNATTENRKTNSLKQGGTAQCRNTCMQKQNMQKIHPKQRNQVFCSEAYADTSENGTTRKEIQS